MRVEYSSSFEKAYRKLPWEIKETAKFKESIFRKHPFHMNLKTHKLHGKMKDFWSFSINNKYRIIFEFVTEDLVRFNAIGTHDVYD